MTTTKKNINKCKHDTRAMTDYLAGELSAKEKKLLEQRLESCESCRAKLAELEKAWNLTAEMLKGEEVGGRKTEDGKVACAVPSANSKNLENIEHRTSNVQHRMEEGKGASSDKKETKKGKLGDVWKKHNLVSKASNFKTLEIAASIILVFIVFIIFGGYQIAKTSMGDSAAGNLKQVGLSMRMYSNVYEDTMPVTDAGRQSLQELEKTGFLDKNVGNPSSKSDTSFFDIVSNGTPPMQMGGSSKKAAKRYRSKSKDYNAPVPAGKPAASLSLTEPTAVEGKIKSRVYYGKSLSGKAAVKHEEAKRIAPPAESARKSSQRAKAPGKLSNKGGLGFGAMFGPSRESKAKTTPKPQAHAANYYAVAKIPKKRGIAKEELRRDRDMDDAFGGEDDEVLAEDDGVVDLVLRKKGEKVGEDEWAELNEAVEIEETPSAWGEVAKQAKKEDSFGDEGGVEVAEKAAEESVDHLVALDEKAPESSFKLSAGGRAMRTKSKKRQLAQNSEAMKTTYAYDAPGSKQNTLIKERVELEKKLLVDPNDQRAINEVKRLTKKMYDDGKQRYEMAQTTRNAEVEWNYVSPLIARSLAPTDEAPEPTPKTISKTKEALDKVIVPNMELEDASIEGVVGQLQKYADKAGLKLETRLSEEAKRQSKIAEKQKKDVKDDDCLVDEDDALIDDAVDDAAGAEKTITIMVDDLTLGETIRNVCIAADMRYKIENGKVIIASKSVPLDPLETVMIPMDKDTFDAMGGEVGDMNGYFTRRGVQALEGAQIVYDENNERLIVKSTKNNINKIKRITQRAKLVTKTLTANLKLWDMKTAQGVVDFLRKHKINTTKGNFKINGNNVTFKLPKAEINKVEKLFFELNETEEKMKAKEQGLPFLRTKQKPFSTFSIDVDTASYTRVAKEIRQGKRPASDSVRPEEFINYFDYHYRSPDRNIFGVNLESAPSVFRPMNTLLRIGVQGKRLGAELKRPSAFTILIDTSGSMANKNRLELVKEAMPMLLAQLRKKDRISIISCGSDIKRVVDMTSPIEKEYILKKVNQIEPLGVTNLENGIIYAYKRAARNYVAGGYNRVLIFTDGISNVSKASAEEILKQIETARQKGITNTVISVGGDGDDSLLEGIADKGDGSYVFLENAESAKELFEDQFSARFREIARDVKIQVEFNPVWVREYRQVGYDNRQLAKSDFRNDKVDAGEVGAGQSVTALYELKVNRIMPLEQKTQSMLPPPNMTIATVRIRYKRADNMAVEEFAYPIRLQEIVLNYAATTPSFKLASAVAEFAEHLKYPETSGIANYNTIRQALRPLLSTTYKNDKKVQGLDELVRLAK